MNAKFFYEKCSKCVFYEEECSPKNCPTCPCNDADDYCPHCACLTFMANNDDDIECPYFKEVKDDTRTN